jgi:hypothetical protein
VQDTRSKGSSSGKALRDKGVPEPSKDVQGEGHQREESTWDVQEDP